MSATGSDRRPNILYFFVDNLGFGELGCYGGGVLRGADTARIDRFAGEGVQLLNFAPEAQCTPSRSALMTGRHGIRSGTHSVPFFGEPGLVAWERTMGDILSEAGYACAIYGKWHVGAEDGRWPTDHGFDEWYGIKRSFDECLWAEDPWYDPERDGLSSTLEGIKGGPVRPVKQLTLEEKRGLARQYVDRATSFMKRSVEAEQPFFLYFNHPLLHIPAVPSDEYKGKSGNGDWADCLLELDGHFAELLGQLEVLGVADDTIVVFFGDNGNEEFPLDRGTAGYWDGSYFTGMEAALRTPCLIRYPGRVPPGKISNEIVHIADLFPTVLGWSGCEVPADRIIDGKDQRDFLEGRQETSNREGFLFWNGDTLYGVKWRHFKFSFYDQRYYTDPEHKLANPKIINLLVDPKERENYNYRFIHTWTLQHFQRLLREFRESLEVEPLIPLGAPVDHIPSRGD